ncbi:MAG: quinohemoprotein amine dehydrogenase subunit alpha [Acidobacteria bacterium]|nr:quinohemoprotein amine dehydrogenase subunit alpha [Acidobacteriota bacterium]
MRIPSWIRSAAAARRVRPSAAPVLAAALIAGGAVASAAQEAPDAPLPEGGIPVTSDLVHRVCGDCHRADEERRMSRISYQRTTPEGWQQTVRRMVLLNDLQIEPEDAREAIAYLATYHGLAPEEAAEAAFHSERRDNLDYYYAADPETQITCNRCHSIGRVLNQRRTREEWDLLTAMHRALYPFTDFQSFMRRIESDESEGGDGPSAVERAVAHLAEVFPLHTPEWTSWAANMRTEPRLEGSWALVGRERGQGPVYGEVVVTVNPDAPDQFRTTASYTYAARGRDVTRAGRARVFTGFQWRGSTTSSSSDQPALREVLSVSRDRESMTGRWFTGVYDELGIDVTLHRAGAQPVLTGVWPPAVPTAGGEVTLQLFGVNLPDALDAASVDLGAGLTVTAVSDASAAEATLRVQVAPDARVGPRDLFVGEAALPDAVVVFDEVHRIAVTPRTGLARVGGGAIPKQYERFEARAWHDGPDGEAETGDDLDLGIVDAAWSLEEYAVTFGDDDTEFVGSIDGQGIFEPALDGPNPERSGERNNVGDVWVVATVSTGPAGVALEPPQRARTHLVVSVPVYLRRGAEGP